jgi:copper chaperone CopZ
MLSVSLLLGCSESATEDSALSNSEAAAMVAEETAKTTPAVFNAEGAPTVTFSVPDMMCEQSCVPTVRETLAAQPGAKEVKVELETKTATVAVDEEAFDAAAAVAALVDLQFTETKLVTADASQAADAKAADNARESDADGSDDASDGKQPNS